MQSLTDILTVLIGLVFVYLILSILTSYLVEIFATWLEKRQEFLANAIQLMLNPTASETASVKQIARAASAAVSFWTQPTKENPDQSENAAVRYFFAHPTIGSLSKPDNLPSYISPDAFTRVIIDMLEHYGMKSEANKIPKAMKERLPESLQRLTLEELRQMLPVDFLKMPFTQLKKMSPEELCHILPELLQNLDPEDIYQLATTDYVSLLEKGLDGLESSNPLLKTTLQPFFNQARLIQHDAQARLQAITTGITTWYNNTMDRATGWYKRYTQRIALAISLVIALAINADSVQIFQSLWSDASLRQVVSSAAVEYVNTHPNIELGNTVVAGESTSQGSQAKASVPTIPDVLHEVQTLTGEIPVPIGWNNFPPRDVQGNLKDPLWSTILLKLIGVLVTTLAISQGSSIWFQLLSKLINLRNTGLKPGEKAAAGSNGDGKG